MKHSEKVLKKLMEIAERDGDDLITSCTTFCDENDLDPVDFIKSLDKGLIEQLKYEAVKANKVRKCVATPKHEIEYD